MAHDKLRAVSSWVTDSQNEICFEDEFLECRLVVLKIVRYMKDNHLTQKDLAETLGVSPQYINKFLHGCDMDMKLSTILRYGRLLGIKLLEVPEDKRNENYKVYVSTQVESDYSQSSPYHYIEALCLALNLKSKTHKVSPAQASTSLNF